MTRYDDIPEVFRRAMEEAGWRGSGEDRPPRPVNARPGKPWWSNRWVFLAILIMILFASFNWIITTYTDWLWFDNLGYRNVWLKQWVVEVVTFVVSFVVAAAFLLFNWHLARRRAMRPARAGVQMLTLPGVGWLITGAALFMSYVMASAAAARWETILRYIYRQPYGTADPIFDLDIGFYLFELPVYNLLRGWLMPLLVITLLGIAAIYILNNLPSVQQQLNVTTLPQPLRPHAAALLVLFFLLWAAGYWLNTYELVYSARGVAFGASYTDLRATLPILWVQAGLMVLLALAIGLLVVRAEPRPAMVIGAIWLLASLGVGTLYPGLLQRYVVEPNELDLEAPYIENNIAYTRLAYGLNDIQVKEFTPDDAITTDDLPATEVALRNVRLWDYRPLLQTYSQLQELRSYYEFVEVDIDRYDLGGETRQVMLAAREMNKTQLQEQTWVNQRLVFTHGYGIVMNPVDEVTPQGLPSFFIKDLPPQSVVDLEIERPEVYYGELTTDVVYANSDRAEFDYPTGDDNAYSHYAGRGGVELNSTLRRLAFAIRFGDTNLILSESITPQTRAMFYRQIQQRVDRIAPFLYQDDDPYLVAADGRLVWVVDAYTVSSAFPYSEPINPQALGERMMPSRINYIRNAAKITIDAYDGSVNFYLADTTDPIVQTYAEAFPDLFQPFEEMPATLKKHIRYPEDMFRLQIEQYLVYHMQDIQVFYNQEDLWQIPQEIFDGSAQLMEPYYVTLALPEAEESEFLLIMPFTPATKNNMISWIAARNDPENYGELIVYEMPKQELVFGPFQVEGRIDQETIISEQFSLWNQLGSRVIRGNLIVIPINNSFLYVEPIYLQSENSALPELKRVILASGEHVVMRETLDEALTALIDRAPPVDEIVVQPPVQDAPPVAPVEDGEPVEPVDSQVPLDADAAQLIQRANEQFLASEQALRDGDWTTYGAQQDALRQTLQRLMELDQ